MFTIYLNSCQTYSIVQQNYRCKDIQTKMILIRIAN